MKLKGDVILAGLDLRMRPALIGADKIWSRLGQELVVTSGLEGEHLPGSLHYYGLALDFRSYYFTKTEKNQAVVILQEKLGNSFEVILHSNHIHVEYVL